MTRRSATFAFLTMLAWTAFAPARLPAGDGPLPADLAFVPADGIGFLHVRLGDIWKSEHFKEWRDTALKAGDQALAAFDKRFIPAPSSIDRLTVVLSRNNQFQQEPDLIVILTTTKPFDSETFLERMAPGAERKQVGGKAFYEVAKQKIGLHFVNDRTLVFGPAESVHRSLRQAPARAGDLALALKQAHDGKPVVVAINAAALMAMLPRGVVQQIPPQFQPVLQAKLATLALDLEKNGRLDLRLVYADAQQAGDAEQAVKAGIALAQVFIGQGRAELRKRVLGDGKPGTLEELPEAAASLFGLGALNRLEEFLENLPLKKDGNALALSVPLPQGGSAVLSMGAVSTALLLPAVQKVREAAARAQGQNNLKQMGLAMHNYHDTYRGLPPAAICDKDGKPLLSWRVAVLPYIEQDNLYRQFKLDEPWDSEHNKKLIPQMPVIYAVPAAPLKVGHTHYQVFVGGGALFDLTKKVGFAQVTDGTSNTLMIVEAADSVIWSKPDDIKFDPKGQLPKLGGFYANGIFNAAFCDGSVRALRVNLPDDTLRALITRSGGEVVDPDR